MGAAAAIPAWAIYTGIAATVASTAYSVHAARQQSRYASAVASQNAALAKQVGAVEAGEERTRADRAAGAYRTALGASAVDVGSGSALEAIADIGYLGEVSARRAQWTRETQGLNFLSEAQLARYRGRTQVGESLLTGASSILDLASSQNWYLGKKTGKG